MGQSLREGDRMWPVWTRELVGLGFSNKWETLEIKSKGHTPKLVRVLDGVGGRVTALDTITTPPSVVFAIRRLIDVIA